MSDALQEQAFAHCPSTQAPLERPLRVSPQTEVNDNKLSPTVGERTCFEIPAWIWRAMIACYAAFLCLLLAATGGARASFAIAISAVYVTMFFGTARAILRQAPPQPPSPLSLPTGKLETIYGTLGLKAVVAQMLVVPGAIVFFGVAVLLIRLIVF